MASASGSRAGLITATVVLAIVSVTALVFAFIFSAEARRNGQALEDITKAYNDVVKRNALTGPTVTQLRERRSAGEPFTTADALLDVAVGERDGLAKLLGGQNAAVASTAAKAALTEANEKLKAAGLPEVSTTDDMAGSVRALANSVGTLSGQVADLTRQANGAKEGAARTVADTQAQLAAKEKQIAEVRAEAEKAIADAAKDRADRQGTVDEINRNVESANKAMAEAQQLLSTRLADADRAKQRLEKEVAEVRTKLAAFRPDAQQSLLRQADAKITRITDASVVYIDIGAGNQIVPGMSFEVYDRVGGVPPIKAGDDVTLPRGKASLEVIRVTPNAAECRVVRTTQGRTIAEGDVVANLVYDRNTKYNFVVYGAFDLTRPGSPEAEDARILKRLITEWGASLQDKVGPSTDFLVIGAEPNIREARSEDEATNPNFLAAQARDREALDAYNAVIAQARDLYIPVLNQNRFLYYVGYHDQSRRVERPQALAQ